MIDVKHIAKLARLGITEEEAEKFQKELSAILDFIEQLKEVNTEDTESTAQVTGLENVMRPDESFRTEDEQRQEILKNAPAREGNYIKVKAVFE